MVEEVKRTVPVIADLRNGNLTSRHWEVLDDVLHMDLRGGETLMFKHMMEVIEDVYVNGSGNDWMQHTRGRAFGRRSTIV